MRNGYILITMLITVGYFRILQSIISIYVFFGSYCCYEQLSTSPDNFPLTTYNEAKMSGVPSVSYGHGPEVVTHLTTTWIHDQSTSDVAEGTTKRPVNTSTESEILSTTEQSVLDSYCPEYGGCEIPKGVAFWYCNCDADCWTYNDCCLDHVKTSRLMTSSKYECVRLRSDIKSFRGFFAISTCPDWYTNETVITKCSQTDILNIGPSVVDNKSMIYKNKYCAYCNNISNFIPFEVQIYEISPRDFHIFANFSMLNEIQKFRVLLQYGEYELIPPEQAKLRWCLPGTIVTQESACNLFINPVLDYKSNWYRNFNCAPKNTQLICAGKIASVLFFDREVIKDLSVIFNFRSETSGNDEKEKCRMWPIQTSSLDECVDLELYENFRLYLEYFLICDANFTTDEISQIGFISISSYEISNFSDVVGDYSIFVHAEDETLFKVEMSIRLKKKLFLEDTYEIKNFFDGRNVVIRINANEFHREQRVILQKDLPQKFGSDFRVIKTVGRTFRDFAKETYYNVSNNIVDILCHDVTINVLRLAGNEMYVETNECHDQNQSTSSGVSFSAVVTYVCFSLSTVSLLGLVFINRKNQQYLNVSTNNLENISISLIFANLVFMIGIGHTKIWKLCYIIGLVLHYLWLAVFTFMSLSVIHVVTGLLQMRPEIPRRKEEVKRRRITFTLIGLCVPLVFVGVAVCVDIWGPPFLSLGYGDSVCFPNKYPANVIFFSGPVILSLIINLVSLVHIIWKIFRIRLKVKGARKLSTYEDAKLYLRMVILSGIFWITGILSAIFPSDVLAYIFIILCGLQGFGLTIANLTTSRFCSKKGIRRNILSSGFSGKTDKSTEITTEN